MTTIDNASEKKDIFDDNILSSSNSDSDNSDSEY